MASTVLPNGIIIPEKFSRDWYSDLYHNWQELDNLLAGGTPKDGTLTIQKNGSTVGTFSANQATDETVNIEVPDVNNGTLTIQQNGTTVDTFTANSSSDKTVNIEVPDVNNGTLTIQKNGTTVGTFSANQATDETINIEVPDVNNGTLTIQQNGTTVDTFTANSSSDKTVNIQCVDLTSNQTVAGNKEFTGTTTAHDVVPSATDTYNLGTSTNKWKTINGYDVTGIGHIGWSTIDQTGSVQTHTRTNPNGGQYAHYCVAPDNGWVSCREHNGSGTFQVCALAYDLNDDPIISSPPLDQFQFGSIPVRKGEYYAIISNNESASHTMRFICNNG